MRLIPWLLLADALLFAPLPAPRASAQEAQPSAAATTLRVSQSAAAPGSTLVAPLYLTAAAGTPVGAITLSLEFPVALLSFEKARRSGLTDALEASLTTEVKKGDGEANATLVLTVSTIGPGGSRRALPDGAIAHTWFRMAKDVKPETVLTLAARATGQTVDDPPRPVTVTVPPVEFIVSAPGVISCFFYMH